MFTQLKYIISIMPFVSPKSARELVNRATLAMKAHWVRALLLTGAAAFLTLLLARWSWFAVRIPMKMAMWSKLILAFAHDHPRVSRVLHVSLEAVPDLAFVLLAIAGLSYLMPGLIRKLDSSKKLRLTAFAVFAAFGVTAVIMNSVNREDQEHQQKLDREKIDNLTGQVHDTLQFLVQSKGVPNELERRKHILDTLRSEYILAHPEASAAMIAGNTNPPAEWMNKRLQELGEQWPYVPPKTTTGMPNPRSYLAWVDLPRFAGGAHEGDPIAVGQSIGFNIYYKQNGPNPVDVRRSLPELAFAYFGGVFTTLRYDNLKSAVKKILRGYQREETTRFIAFRSHWGFASEFCTPGEGHEKGGVEGEGGYFRRNHLVPVPQVASWEELNVLLLEASKQDEQRMIGERTQTVGAGMHTEREHLRALAEEGFDLAAVHFPHVNASGCIRVLTNFYSVPPPVGVEVQAKVYSTYVEIWHQGQCVARHERCFDRQQKVLDLEHYLEALTKKPGAFAGSTPLEQWRAQGRWPVSFDRYWEMLKQRQGRQSGTRAMIDVLLLGRQYGYPSLKIAIEKALDMSCFDVDAVRLLLDAEGLGRREPEPVEIGALRCYDRPQPTTTNYDQLLRNAPVTGVIQ